MSSRIAKLTRRRLYKPERAPARKKGVITQHAPVALPDATEPEVRAAVFAMAWEAGVVVGQGSGYDPLKDEYAVIGKSRATGKAQDWKIAGADIADLIVVARYLNGGRMSKKDARRLQAR